MRRVGAIANSGHMSRVEGGKRHGGRKIVFREGGQRLEALTTNVTLQRGKKPILHDGNLLISKMDLNRRQRPLHST